MSHGTCLVAKARDLFALRRFQSQSALRNIAEDTEHTKVARRLTLIHFPVTLAVIAHLQETVLRIMPLATAWTNQVPTPTRALLIIVLRYSKRCSATARDKKHTWMLFVFVLRTCFGFRL